MIASAAAATGRYCHCCCFCNADAGRCTRVAVARFVSVVGVGLSLAFGAELAAKPKACASFAAALLAWWLAAVVCNTFFFNPFTKTAGNGYFGTWFACIGACFFAASAVSAAGGTRAAFSSPA